MPNEQLPDMAAMQAVGGEADPMREEIMAILSNMPPEVLQQLVSMPPEQLQEVLSQIFSQAGVSPEDMPNVINTVLDILDSMDLGGGGGPGGPMPQPSMPLPGGGL